MVHGLSRNDVVRLVPLTAGQGTLVPTVQTVAPGPVPLARPLQESRRQSPGDEDKMAEMERQEAYRLSGPAAPRVRSFHCAHPRNSHDLHVTVAQPSHLYL